MSSGSAPQIERQHKHWPGRVLVGFDGSAASDSAVLWAIREVAARGSSLRVGSSATKNCLHRNADELNERRLSRLLHELHDEHPSLVADLTTEPGDPRQVLVAEAKHFDLLVLAATADDSAEAVLLGSLARTAVRRSPCPVVVVRGNSTRPVRRIVIGVDGSSAAAAAIDWACEEANLHRADLLVIHAREGDISRAEAGRVLELAVDECRHRTAGAVRGRLSDGDPASAVVEASHDADIVTIGSRGRSGFKTALFGSVALSVAGGAHCPVAVTHPTPRLD